MRKACTYEQAVTTITDSLAFHPYPGTDVHYTFMDLKYMYERSLQKCTLTFTWLLQGSLTPGLSVDQTKTLRWGPGGTLDSALSEKVELWTQAIYIGERLEQVARFPQTYPISLTRSYHHLLQVFEE